MFPSSLKVALALSFLPLFTVFGAFDLGFRDDTDLTSFVTRPEIKAPLFNVNVKHPELVTPGYWFVAPYALIEQDTFARHYYQPCQTGPAIYDNSGELVWSGACKVRNQNTCDFRLVETDDSYLLSAIFMDEGDNKKGLGVIMDSSYTSIGNVSTSNAVENFNMHEFKLTDGGKSALFILNKQEYVELDEDLDTEEKAGWIWNLGFREVDTASGAIKFEWWAFPEVRLQESKIKMTHLRGPHPKAWNFFHMNSVDKNDHGDYMVSARFTDTIYKISGRTGKVEWRLEGSGKRSDFVHERFNFSRQHDAQWLEHSETREIISFLDNGADTSNKTSNHSSALVVELDKTQDPWTARVLKRWVRPDGKLSRLRGNSQVLKNGNLFNCWSDNSYLSEHTPEGEVVMEAKFQSTRFVTYRGYKFNFSSTPVEPPALKSFVYGTNPDRSTTVSYMSWNGATEVSSWNLFQTNNSTGDTTLIGHRRRNGFETSIQTDGHAQFVFAEALAADGLVLGRTDIFKVVAPDTWPHDENSAKSYEASNGSISEPVALQAISPISGVSADYKRPESYSIYNGECRPLIAILKQT